MKKRTLPLAALSLTDIGRNRHGGTSDLRRKAEPLDGQEPGGHPVNIFDERHRIPPDFEIPERAVVIHAEAACMSCAAANAASFRRIPE
jgi:hypothetical protein